MSPSEQVLVLFAFFGDGLCKRWTFFLSRRELLQRDEAILRHLLQQELKKRDSLKAAEAKVVKLREQLQASEKIVFANKTLLKKLQEQVGPLDTY